MGREDKSCSGNCNSTSEVDSVGIGGGNHVAELVHDNHVAGSALINSRAGCNGLAGCIELDGELSCSDCLLSLFRRNLGCTLCGIFLGNDGIDRNVIVGRVGHVGVSVLVAHCKGLGHEIDRLRAVRTIAGDVEVLKDVQSLEKSSSTRGRTVGRINRVASVCGGNRLAHHGSVLCEILMCQDSADALDVVDHLVCELAVIEALDSLIGNQLQRVGKILVGDDISDAVHEAFICVETHGVVVGAEVGIAAFDVGVPSLGHREAVSGKVDDRLKNLSGGHGAPHLKSGKGSVDNARDGDGCHRRRVVRARCLDLAGNGSTGGLCHVFDGDVLVLVGKVHGHLTCSAYSACSRLEKTDGIDHADGCVDCVSAALEDIHCNLCCNRACACSGSVGTDCTCSEDIAGELIHGSGFRDRLCGLFLGLLLCRSLSRLRRC